MPLLLVVIGFVLMVVGAGCFCVFFDQAVFNRRGTIYRFKTHEKRIALTFDDGPSLQWTPRILDELKLSEIKATFFMVGHHVEKYPDIARRVAREGHLIANHGYFHNVMLYYTLEEIKEEILRTENIIKEVTGQTTQYFRPPKAWLRTKIKKKIDAMGYRTVLWSLNSKDWVLFNHKSIVSSIDKNIRNGDILLFHDSGNVFKPEGGNRRQTVKAISLLARTLRKRGFEFVTIEELTRDKSLV